MFNKTLIIYKGNQMNISNPYRKKSISGIFSSLLSTFLSVLLINSAAIAQQEDSLYVGKTWQISKGLDFANHQYTDIPVYNCNGSKALFMGRKGKFYISTNLNSTPTLIKFPEQPKGKLEWDKKKPAILYFLTYKKDITRVHQFNVESGEDKIIYTTENYITEISPTHPDGDHLLLAPKDQANSVMEIYSLSKGESIKIPMDVPLHRVRFTTSPDLTVFVNRSGKLLLPKTSWLVDPQTKQKRQVYQGASTSPNWRLGGNNFCFYGTYNGSRGLLVLDTNGTVVKSFPQLTNHHLSWSPDGKYIVTDVEKDPENKKKSLYPGWICVVNYETGEIRNIVEHESEFDDREGDKYSAGHPHPQLSPDATKVIYNSSKFGMDHPHVFVSLVKLPESVKNASAKRESDKMIIEWQNPDKVELKECIVYSIHKNGKAELIGSVDLTGTKLVTEYNPDVTGYNIVTKEYSGLTSKPYSVKL